MYIPVRAAIKSDNLKHLLTLSIFDRRFMFHVEFPFVDTIQSQTNKFLTGVKKKATGD